MTKSQAIDTIKNNEEETEIEKNQVDSAEKREIRENIKMLDEMLTGLNDSESEEEKSNKMKKLMEDINKSKAKRVFRQSMEDEKEETKKARSEHHPIATPHKNKAKKTKDKNVFLV